MRKDPRPEEKGMPKGKKNTVICICEGSPSGRVRREIPGVTQVDENGHEGNTAVVTACRLEETWDISFMRNK